MKKTRTYKVFLIGSMWLITSPVSSPAGYINPGEIILVTGHKGICYIEFLTKFGRYYLYDGNVLFNAERIDDFNEAGSY